MKERNGECEMLCYEGFRTMPDSVRSRYKSPHHLWRTIMRNGIRFGQADSIADLIENYGQMTDAVREDIDIYLDDYSKHSLTVSKIYVQVDNVNLHPITSYKHQSPKICEFDITDGIDSIPGLFLFDGLESTNYGKDRYREQLDQIFQAGLFADFCIQCSALIPNNDYKFEGEKVLIRSVQRGGIQKAKKEEVRETPPGVLI